MISVYPYASGSLYIASHAVSASYANSANYIAYVTSASKADVVIYPESGSRGKSVCLLTTAQYKEMVLTGKKEVCLFT